VYVIEIVQGAALAASGAMTGAAAPQVADQLATARFAEIMAPPVGPLAPMAQAVAQTYPQAGSMSLGDSVLAGMRNMQSSFQETVQKVSASLEPGAQMTLPDMLKMQLSLVQLSVQVEVASKAIGRSTQNIDQLVRIQ
jgi:type III secretion system YscI/HrpB-like protein